VNEVKPTPLDKVRAFIGALWEYCVVGTWVYLFPPKEDDKPGDDAA
jgi:hypothetical protein